MTDENWTIFQDTSATTPASLIIQLDNREENVGPDRHVQLHDLVSFASELKQISTQYGAFFTISDVVSSALAVRIDQLPEERHEGLCVLRTDSVKHALKAERQGYDAVIFGPVFDPVEVTGYDEVQGLDALEKVAKRLSIPVYAFGGISALRVVACLEAGAYGVAVTSSVLHAGNYETAIQGFRRRWNPLPTQSSRIRA